MSDLITRHMAEPYIEQFGAPMFLASFFNAVSFTSEKYEVDIQRSTGKVAIAVQDMASGARMNSVGSFSNKDFEAAVLKEALKVNGFDLMKRRPGQASHVDPDFGANLNASIMRGLPMVVDKVRRTCELMCSQVLQTGTVTLTDEAGAAMYTINFSPKATHFPTVSVSWGGVSPSPIADLNSLCKEIKKNGRTRPNRAVFGAVAFQNFITDDSVKSALDTRRLDLGLLRADEIQDNGTYWGDLNVGSAVLEIWTYDGDYEDPADGLVKPYVADDKVIVLSRGSRLTLAYGAMPFVAPPDPRVMSLIPGRVGGGGVDLTFNGYIEPNNQALTVEVGARPIAIPVGIDTFGCLDTVI